MADEDTDEDDLYALEFPTESLFISEGRACLFDEDMPTGKELKEALKHLAIEHSDGLDAKAATRHARSGSSSRRASRQASRQTSRQASRSREASPCTPNTPASRQRSPLSRSPLSAGNSVDVCFMQSLKAGVSPATVAIVLDWDDTLCPTTWLREDCGLDWTMPLEELPNPNSQRSVFVRKLVDAHVASVKSFLVEARKHGKIIILTLANRPWVEISLKHWMPDLAADMKELGVSIVYAQEYVNEDDLALFEEDEDGGEEVWTHAKEAALLTTLNGNPNPWYRIVSIGDSEYERQAARQAGKKLNDPCSTQTLKLLEDPSIEELTGEVRMLQHWISHLAGRQGDFDDEIETPEDDLLQELHGRITGELDKSLTWSDLCGLGE